MPPSRIPRVSSLLFALVTLGETGIIHAFGTGAGSCLGGQAAVGGSHVEAADGKNIQVGELFQGGVTVTLDGDTTNPWVPNQAVVLQTQTDYTITVATNGERGFAGILLRLSRNADADAATADAVTLVPVDATILQVATECLDEGPTVQGVTHISNVEKKSIAAVLRIDAPGAATLDVTLVGANTPTLSIYGYNGFALDIQGEAATAAPVATLAPGDTFAPTTAPTVSDITGTLSPTYHQNAESTVTASASAVVGTVVTAVGTAMFMALVLI